MPPLLHCNGQSTVQLNTGLKFAGLSSMSAPASSPTSHSILEYIKPPETRVMNTDHLPLVHTGTDL